MSKDDHESNIVYEHVEESEFKVAELNLGPLYVYKLLKPLNGKNLVKTKSSLQKHTHLT